MFQLLQHGRLLPLDLLPASPGFAHPLIRSQVSLEFPQSFVDRGSTQTAGRCNLRDPAAAEQLRIRGGDQAPLTLVQVRAQLAVFLPQWGLRSHTFSLKCFGGNVQLLWIGCGSEDSFFAASESLSKMLDDAGIKHVFHKSSGAHTWINWRHYLNEFAPLLF